MNIELGKAVKLALFQHPKWESSFAIITQDEAKWTDKVQISPWIEVTFPGFPVAQIVAARVAGLDKAIEETWASAKSDVEELLKVKNDLLAIEFDPSTVSQPSEE
jgi:antitoxin (DNA-binding transcriptional repressor) of toxin-antitoxin stability system